MKVKGLVLVVLLYAHQVGAQNEADGGAFRNDPPDATVPAPVPAPVAAPVAAPAPVATPAPVPEPEPVKKKKKKAKSEVKATGRVFMAETLSNETGAWTSQSAITSARMGVDYHRKNLRVRVDMEFRKSAKLRSAYIELKLHDGFAVKAGFFKIPFSPIEFGSSWALPMADRGLISNALKDGLQLAGRRTGSEVIWTPPHAKGNWHPRALAGYWQGNDSQGNPLLADSGGDFGKVGIARFEFGPFGASGELRTGRPILSAPIRRAWAAEVDATIESCGLRAWAEASVGSSWLSFAIDRSHTTFAEGRTVVAWRAGGAKKGARYVEPYVLLGVLDPDLDLSNDRLLEATGGVNVGDWQRWRLQAELEVWRMGKQGPTSIAVADTGPANRTAGVLQLGAAF